MPRMRLFQMQLKQQADQSEAGDQQHGKSNRKCVEMPVNKEFDAGTEPKNQKSDDEKARRP